jgi:hypothetical protein
MKKLISLLEAVTSVAPNLYPYLDFPAKAVGSSTPASDKINDVLLSDINAATKAAGLTKTSITTAVSGHKSTTTSGNPSRHTGGTAVDIAIINGSAITKDTGDKLVAQLKGMGYDTSGSESGHPKAVLWQVASHFNHVHVSNTTGAPSTPGSVTTSGGTSVDGTPTAIASSDSKSKYKMAADSIFTDALTTGLNKIGVQTESRLDRDINKIKKLLK